VTEINTHTHNTTHTKTYGQKELFDPFDMDRLYPRKTGGSERPLHYKTFWPHGSEDNKVRRGTVSSSLLTSQAWGQ